MREHTLAMYITTRVCSSGCCIFLAYIYFEKNSLYRKGFFKGKRSEKRLFYIGGAILFLLLQVGGAEPQREETVSISETSEQTKTETREEESEGENTESESLSSESEESQSQYSQNGIPTSVFSEYWSDRELNNPEEVYPGFRVTLEKNSVYGTYSPAWWHEETGLTIRSDRGAIFLKTRRQKENWKVCLTFVIMENMK